VGIAPTDYLEELGASLDPAIEVGWTGRTIVSPGILAEEAAVRASTLRRRLLVWDNVPVADGPMRPMLHLGPYRGREPALAEHVSGIVLNTMQHARASGLAVATAAAWLQDPAGYDAERAWDAACEELGAGAPAAFRVFASAHRFSPCDPSDRDRALEAAFADVQRAAVREESEPLRTALRELRGLLASRAEVAEALRERLEDRALAGEIEPWITSHHAETRRMQAAVEIVETVLGDAPRLARAIAFFGFAARTAVPTTGLHWSYGPRRVLYPQLVSLRDDEAGFGNDPALFSDRCLADEIVRFAEELALSRLGGRIAR
jgi:hyaluronoglucosaminidase